MQLSTLDDVAAEGVNELPFFLAIFALPFLLTILLTLAEDAGDGAGGASQPSHFQVEDANVRSVVRSNDAHVLRDPRLVKLASHAAAEIVNSIRRAKKTAEERRARAHAPGLDVPALTASQDGALAAAKTVSVRATALEITLAVIRETLSTYHTIAGGM